MQSGANSKSTESTVSTSYRIPARSFIVKHTFSDEDTRFIEPLSEKQQSAVERTPEGSLHFQPVEAHVTLFKAGDGDDEG